ncbi:arginase family protein [Plebeiibacterium sediminum]|uniref:Arginase family protein n=1 Tax=Plebeiibacterium sediminum TaxID=2992112 RepID=A0AAE3M7N9_9BACT|nr:arginase family protein [Plebeiobacterium sediminum]MCW3788618.1 arginase family protein [Plebeiobacterium sediminum]
MTIKDFLEPVKKPQFISSFMKEDEALCSQIEYGFFSKDDEEISKYDVAIIGIEDAKNALDNKGVELAADYIRTQLGLLRKTTRELKIIDLGNIKGNTLDDRYFALREVGSKLIKYQVFVVVLGGAQDYLLPVIQSLTTVDDEIAISLIDSRLDFAVEEVEYSSKSYLSHIKSEFASQIFELNILGVQKYFVGSSQDELMREMCWEYVRLGDIRNENIKYTEPFLRDADVVGFDVGAIQSSYIPYYNNINVNGLTGYEACQIAWYSGLSDKLKFFCLQEYNPSLDIDRKGTMLCAQIIWHLLEGESLKITEVPSVESENYKIFVVHLHNFNQDIRFYTNRVNGRWWIEVPWKESIRLLSCSKDVYDDTQKGNLPDKWWRFFRKGAMK